MTLFLSPDALRQRKEQLRDPSVIGGLATSLLLELHNALDVPVPDGKSRLTRHGGRCVRCTVLLTFDPRSPHAHTCPSCATVYTDPVHHEWWLMNGHLWTAEQCTRAAALAYFLDDDGAAQRADNILATYATRYLTWPNRDNALGPTRPFFSTYLESIWLLHIAAALDLRIASAGQMLAPHSVAIDRIIAPSAALIAGFDEGRSNRQVWHVAALLAASRLLNDDGMRDRAAMSLVSLLRTGLHSDGSWYEGENYHLFAHRGLLSGVTLAERAGVTLPAGLLRRFEDGFAAPFRTMLPDGTFPARRDSQYGVAIRQYRTADWLECGFARRDTPELRAALASLYAEWPAPGDTHRWSSSADAERNQPGVQLRRSDCSWRALLLARTALPELSHDVPHSELLEGQGLAVFRRDGGRFWVGLDYGDPGDGHGHPDRLNLVIATQDARWLDDVGTGSYTSPTLSWYRSSMAHNAPMVNRRDQGEAHGRLLAHDEQGDIGWVSAEFIDPASGVRCVRTVVVTPEYVLDEMEWSSSVPVMLDLPIQAALIDAPTLTWEQFEPNTAQDAILANAFFAPIGGNISVAMVLRSLPSPTVPPGTATHDAFECFLVSEQSALLWRAETVGPPAGKAHGLVSLRQHGTAGRSVRVFAKVISVAVHETLGHVASVATSEAFGVRVTTTDGTNWFHTRTDAGYAVDRAAPSSTSHVELRGIRERLGAAATEPPENEPVTIRLRPSSPLIVPLSEEHYRRTEASWHDAGSPRAQVTLSASPERSISLLVHVDLGRPPHFTTFVAENPLDNELADVNSDGVQLHWRSDSTGVWNSALAVPEPSLVRLTAAEGALDGLTATWEPFGNGYTVAFVLPWHQSTFAFDVIVNDCPPDRERRRGQLVLSGAHGEFAYLRGARQSDARALHIAFDPVQS